MGVVWLGECGWLGWNGDGSGEGDKMETFVGN